VGGVGGRVPLLKKMGDASPPRPLPTTPLDVNGAANRLSFVVTATAACGKSRRRAGGLRSTVPTGTLCVYTYFIIAIMLVHIDPARSIVRPRGRHTGDAWQLALIHKVKRRREKNPRVQTSCYCDGNHRPHRRMDLCNGDGARICPHSASHLPTYFPVGYRKRKCADRIGTVLVPWAGHFQC